MWPHLVLVVNCTEACGPYAIGSSIGCVLKLSERLKGAHCQGLIVVIVASTRRLWDYSMVLMEARMVFQVVAPLDLVFVTIHAYGLKTESTSVIPAFFGCDKCPWRGLDSEIPLMSLPS